MIDYELMLFDRLNVIKDVNAKFDLEHNAYIAFSGGKDSTVLHHLVDMALPGNKIPRVFCNTGIEYKSIVSYVKELASSDDRFFIINPMRPIKKVLSTYGYPFKSKEHSLKLSCYQKGHISPSIVKYMNFGAKFACPKSLSYQFSPLFKLKVSNLCCYKLKKEPFALWETMYNRHIALTGLLREEGGQRANIGSCVIYDKDGNISHFHPLLVVTHSWEDEFIRKNDIRLCELYYPPFNFKRTGCKGCPYSLDLQEQLSVMSLYLPQEREQCEFIWKPVYEEYRRIGYRLDRMEQMKLF